MAASKPPTRWRIFGQGAAAAGLPASAEEASAARDAGHIAASGGPVQAAEGPVTQDQLEASLRAAASPLSGHPKYQYVKDLDKGSFGFVQKAVDLTTGEEVAIKFLERNVDVSKYVSREIMNHRKLQHPHIIQLREVFLTQKYLAIVMEFASGGNLYSFVSSGSGLSEVEARWFFQQIIAAVAYCHGVGLCNRDLKLENTLLTGLGKPLVKLCDFGYSKDVNEHSAAGSKVGTPAYLAPEVVRANGHTVYDGRKADIWSCGVMLFAMVTADYPFSRHNEDATSTHGVRRMLQRILRADYRIPADKAVSASCQDLIERLLTVDPEQRITLRGIFDHEWFRRDLPGGVEALTEALIAQHLSRGAGGGGSGSDDESFDEDDWDSDEEESGEEEGRL